MSWKAALTVLYPAPLPFPPQKKPTRVQIWEREGCELHAVGEEAPALYPLLSWQPNGRHLYAARALGSSLQAQQAQHGVAAVDEQAQQARIGAWKREMRRKEAEAAAAAAAAGEVRSQIRVAAGAVGRVGGGVGCGAVIGRCRTGDTCCALGRTQYIGKRSGGSRHNFFALVHAFVLLLR